MSLTESVRLKFNLILEACTHRRPLHLPSVGAVCLVGWGGRPGVGGHGVQVWGAVRVCGGAGVRVCVCAGVWGCGGGGCVGGVARGCVRARRGWREGEERGGGGTAHTRPNTRSGSWSQEAAGLAVDRKSLQPVLH